MTGFMTVEDRQKQTMRLLNDYLNKLPILTKVMTKISELEYKDPKLADKLEKLTKIDPTLAIRVIYLGSHLFAGNEDQSTTLSKVFFHVGAETILKHLTKDSIVPVFMPNNDEEKELWLHSLHLALGMKFLAGKFPEWSIDPEEAYLAGLIHEVGRFIMLATSADSFRKISAGNWETGKALVTEEIKVCGFDHSALGWLALRQWNFPERLSNVAKYHHIQQDLDKKITDVKTFRLTLLCHIMDGISFLMLYKPGFIFAHPKIQAQEIEKAGLIPKSVTVPFTIPQLCEVIRPIYDTSLKLAQTIIYLPTDHKWLSLVS